MIHHVLLTICLALVVLCCCIGSLGAWRMRDPVQSLHYLALPTGIGAVSLAAAVWLEIGWSSATAKTIAICMVLIVTNSAGAHAAARAIRVRKLGHWQPRKEDGVEFVAREGRP